MFDFTREERGVILFVVFLALAGAGISYLTKKYAPIRRTTYMSEKIAKVNLNTADKYTLMLVSGVGEKIAERIIERRNELGAFGDAQELRSVKGINKHNFEKIKDLVYVPEK